MSLHTSDLYEFGNHVRFPSYSKFLKYDEVSTKFNHRKASIKKTMICCICCSSCKLDMFKFPFDTQICRLEFGNVIEPDVTVNVTIATDWGFALTFYSESNEYTLKSTDAHRTKSEVCCMQINHHIIREQYRGQARISLQILYLIET